MKRKATPKRPKPKCSHIEREVTAIDAGRWVQLMCSHCGAIAEISANAIRIASKDWETDY